MNNDTIVAKYDEHGREIMDSTPLEATLKVRPKTMFDRMREQAMAASQLAAMEGFDTLEEANDFEIGDDYEPESPYEEQFGPNGDSSFEPPTSTKEPAGAEPAKEGDPPAEQESAPSGSEAE